MTQIFTENYRNDNKQEAHIETILAYRLSCSSKKSMKICVIRVIRVLLKRTIMKKLHTIITTFIIIIGITGNLWAAPGVMEILKKMDQIETLGEDITVKFDLTETKANQGIRVMEGVYYRRDRDDAYLIVMTGPDAQKGNGYLRVGDSMWMYRRNTRTFQIMSRAQSIEDSDVNAGDLESRKYVDLYEPVLDDQGNELLSEETLGKANISVYRIEVNAKVKDVSYPKKIYWVRQDNSLKLKEASYSLSGTLMETAYYPKYTTVEGKYLFVKQLVIDEFDKGNKTLLELSGISMKSIDNNVFTKAYLENLSK